MPNQNRIIVPDEFRNSESGLEKVIYAYSNLVESLMKLNERFGVTVTQGSAADQIVVNYDVYIQTQILITAAVTELNQFNRALNVLDSVRMAMTGIEFGNMPETSSIDHERFDKERTIYELRRIRKSISNGTVDDFGSEEIKEMIYNHVNDAVVDLVHLTNGVEK